MSWVDHFEYVISQQLANEHNADAHWGVGKPPSSPPHWTQVSWEHVGDSASPSGRWRLLCSPGQTVDLCTYSMTASAVPSLLENRLHRLGSQRLIACANHITHTASS